MNRCTKIKKPSRRNLNSLLTEKVHKSKSYLYKRNRLKFIIKYNICESLWCLWCLFYFWMPLMPLNAFNVFYSFYSFLIICTLKSSWKSLNFVLFCVLWKMLNYWIVPLRRKKVICLIINVLIFWLFFDFLEILTAFRLFLLFVFCDNL